jgi:hypothetical protein
MLLAIKPPLKGGVIAMILIRTLKEFSELITPPFKAV